MKRRECHHRSHLSIQWVLITTYARLQEKKWWIPLEEWLTVNAPSSQSRSWIRMDDDMLAQLVYNSHKTEIYPYKSTQLEDMPNVQWGHDSDNLEIRCISTTTLFFFLSYIELRAKWGRVKTDVEQLILWVDGGGREWETIEGGHHMYWGFEQWCQE